MDLKKAILIKNCKYLIAKTLILSNKTVIPKIEEISKNTYNFDEA